MFAAAFLSATVWTGCGGSGRSSAPPPTPIPAPPANNLGTVVDQVVRANMQQGNAVGVSVALAKSGVVFYSNAYGVAVLAAQRAATPATIFEIGSITKQFTAAIVMKLQEQGMLKVDDLVATYLPQYSFPRELTIRQLLNQTSGLADYVNFPDFPNWENNGVAESTVLAEVAAAGVHFTPGTQYEYSNSNYFILGSIIEKVTQQSYSSVLSQLILKPLGLNSTYYELPPAANSALGYGVAMGAPRLLPASDRTPAFAAGAISSNVVDLVNWDHLLMTGQVVSPASFQQMITPPPNVNSPSGIRYGFGLVRDTYLGRPDIWHDGEIPGFNSANAVFLDDGFTVVVLTNSDPFDAIGLVDKIIVAVCTNSQLASNC